ncbi:MAG: hypothetical protein ACTHXA_10795 [Gulosibacter sp.]|uniref:hypothetical protein n=1 Tax=Gulosibacter sp. TaxID=2817531 RepID=UPI003F93F53A
MTNLSQGLLYKPGLIAECHDLWRLERSCRLLTSDRAARPFFYRELDSFKAHLTVVFAALPGRIRDWSVISAVVKAVRSLRSARIAVNGDEQTIPLQIPSELAPNIKALLEVAMGHCEDEAS